MEKDTLQQLVEEGLSQRDIAIRLGKSHASVRYWLHKYQLGTVRIHKCKCGECNPAKFTEGRYTECKRCRNKDQSERFRNYKKEAVAYKGGCCQSCGYNKCYAALDFHHKDPNEKDPRWKKMRNWTFEKVKKEIDKCDLVCKNCHAEIHYGVKACR